MEQARLSPAVILPDRRGRRLAVGAALALMVAGGASTYVGTVYPPRAVVITDASSHERGTAGTGDSTVRVTFETDPGGAEVLHAGDHSVLCLTPCELFETTSSPSAEYVLQRPGYDSRDLAVRLDGGDTLVRASLSPIGDQEN
jgi:hypothetical protein